MKLEELEMYLQECDKKQEPNQYELLKKLEREEKALEKLSWESVKEIRNLNTGCRLYPLDWPAILRKADIKGITITMTEEEFKRDLKELCDALYNWNLYEECPVCHHGIRVPIWTARQWTPFCGCSNYPDCANAIDRGGDEIPLYKFRSEL